MNSNLKSCVFCDKYASQHYLGIWCTTEESDTHQFTPQLAEQSYTPPATPFPKCPFCHATVTVDWSVHEEECPDQNTAEEQVAIAAQTSPAGAAEWRSKYVELAGCDPIYRMNGELVKLDGVLDAYAEHIVAPIRQERDEAKRLIQSDKNIDREWSDETLIQSVTIALNALHWRNLTIEAIEREVAQLRKELEPMINHCTNACQVFDGWHNDGTAWSEWDESVRKEMSGVVRKLYELSGAK